jgi:hypothetical protein
MPYNSTMKRNYGENCTYNLTVTSSIYNSTQNITRQPSCGPNEDNYLYCPKYRSEDIVLASFSTLWSEEFGMNCSTSTSIQYCAAIEDNPALSYIFRQWMAYMWITALDSRYSLVANNPPCVQETILDVLGYWRIKNGAKTIALSLFAMIWILF